MSDGSPVLVVQPDTWPLMRGETLSNHDWFEFHGHRFLGSRFLAIALMEGRRADVATALILWSEAMRQDPAGTLPECDLELASLARFASVDEWRACKDTVMHGWERVSVEDARTGEVTARLGHTVFLQLVVERMYKRKRTRDGAREAAASSVRKSRIRKKMEEMRIPKHMIADDLAVGELAAYFEQSNLYITVDNLRAAMITCLGYTGEVARFPRKKNGDV